MRKPLALALILAAAPAAAGENAPKSDSNAVDVAPFKDKLVVVTDGKKHFVAVVPFGDDVFGQLFYGDGKTFYQQRVAGGGASGNESFDRVYWDPRIGPAYKRAFGFKDKKYSVQCGERITDMKPLSDDEQKAMIGAAAFRKPRWTHRAYALARDEAGSYYYVDKLREPEDNKAFRLFVGPKGRMKQQKMINVVSDSEGDMFATKTGQLRLILNKNESLWVKGKEKTKLLLVPVEDNGAMIYSELGPYIGERLGTPCDDL